MKDRKVISILIVLGVIFTILGATLAYWSWSSTNAQKTNVTFTIGANFSCSANGGGNITNTNYFVPTTCTNSTYAIKREITTSITNNSGEPVYMDMWLNINSIGTGLSQSSNFKYALTTSNSSCTTGVVSEGTFQGKVANDKIQLLNQVTTASTYYLYIWLDAAETSSSTMNQSVSLSLGGECTNEKPPKKGQPVLDDGMIPVTIANNGTVTTVTEDDDSWFDYDNKIWANAVLVKESGVKTRAQNKVAGTVINQDDILAYFVWIPRYSYKIWTLDASSDHTGQEQTIDIKFVDINTKENGSAVGDYYTHPAFTFGTEELPGFWVGKFESSTDTSSTCYTSPSDSNCNNTNQSPKIVPNVDSLRYQTVGNAFATALKFAGGTQSGSNITFVGSSTYGLTSTADSHMMKNSEWGAVAYLSHSEYGINNEIRINNYRKDTTTYATLTGCGASTANASAAVTCGIAYGSVSLYPQSTTGNISGVFDMSGGAGEYVMGNYNNTANATYFSTLPSSKYYDVYLASQFTGDYSTNMTFCTFATCGGHALNETRAWYSDYADFVYSSSPWFMRGGVYSTSSSQYAGAFNLNSRNGSTYYYTSWRGVLVVR